MDLLQLMAGLSTVLQRPWDIRWTQYSGGCLLHVAPIRYRPAHLVEQGKMIFMRKAFSKVTDVNPIILPSGDIFLYAYGSLAAIRSD